MPQIENWPTTDTNPGDLPMVEGWENRLANNIKIIVEARPGHDDYIVSRYNPDDVEELFGPYSNKNEAVEAARSYPKGHPYAGYGARLDQWQRVALLELIEELDAVVTPTDAGYIEMSNSGSNAFAVEAVRDTEINYESAWVVFRSYSVAKEAAKDEVYRNLRHRPQMFSESFLKRHTYVQEIEIGEYAARHAESITSSMEAASLFDEAEWPEHERPESADDPRWDAKIEQAAEDARVKVTERLKNEIMSDPYTYFAEQTGMEADEMLESTPIKIREDQAAEDAIRTDGVAHFIDKVDGELIELPSGAVAAGVE